MNANKLFSEFSIKKIWDKLLQHDKAMNSTILVLPSGNWSEQEDGTFKNTVSYKGFTENDKLTVDLYDDGNLSETQLNEYEQYIDSFETINGSLVAIANTRPTQTMTVVVKGDFEVDKVELTSIECVNDFESTETNVPASGNLTRLLKEDINDVKSNLSGEEFGYNDEGDFCHRQVGADTWIPFKNLAKDTPATATADMLTEGFTAWVNGELITGTRPSAPNTLSGSGSTWKDWDQLTMSGSVTFSTPFDKVPTVSAYVSYAHDNGYGVTGRFSMSVSNVSRTGFDWRITTSSWEKPAAITFTWTAKTA